MLKIKSFINNKKIFLSLIVFIFYISNVLCQNVNKEIGEECKVNLNCHSGCCNSGKCSETQECAGSISTYYTYQAIASAALVIIFSIYLFLKLRCIKNNLEEKKTQSKQK